MPVPNQGVGREDSGAHFSGAAEAEVSAEAVDFPGVDFPEGAEVLAEEAVPAVGSPKNIKNFRIRV